jgi:hypothetical protein
MRWLFFALALVLTVPIVAADDPAAPASSPTVDSCEAGPHTESSDSMPTPPVGLRPVPGGWEVFVYVPVVAPMVPQGGAPTFERHSFTYCGWIPIPT